MVILSSPALSFTQAQHRSPSVLLIPQWTKPKLSSKCQLVPGDLWALMLNLQSQNALPLGQAPVW